MGSRHFVFAVFCQFHFKLPFYSILLSITVISKRVTILWVIVNLCKRVLPLGSSDTSSTVLRQLFLSFGGQETKKKKDPNVASSLEKAFKCPRDGYFFGFNPNSKRNQHRRLYTSWRLQEKRSKIVLESRQTKPNSIITLSSEPMETSLDTKRLLVSLVCFTKKCYVYNRFNR